MSVRLTAFAAALLLSGCGGVQSALEPAGPEAARIVRMFNIMFAGGVAIALLVCAFTAAAYWGGTRLRARLASPRMIFAWGVAFPVVTLSALLIYGFAALGAGASVPAGEPVRIHVSAERWWWRVAYMEDGARLFETANELRIPVGRPVEIEVVSPDVIHSLWAPKLGGKIDAIPGRVNTLRLSAAAPGVYRGQCAEYCGGAHALMSLEVVALPPEDYARWRATQIAPARAPQDETAREGAALFRAAGCGGCHTVRGTQADGALGPDLTHVGSRRLIAAATLPANGASFQRWIAHNQEIKPGNLMPNFPIFTEAERAALARYLEELQ